jgi:NAD(P)-dependent dehydrogenase (short-subunit alcohol dehydrogenase family)
MVDTTAGPMVGKTVLVTGGTGGIGKATATGLATMGARVGITGRDTARARAAAAEIAVASGNPAVDPFPADTSSQAEVRRLAGKVLAAYLQLDVLVNNVGGFWSTPSRSTTSPRSCSPACSSTGSQPAPRPGS